MKNLKITIYLPGRLVPDFRNDDYGPVRVAIASGRGKACKRRGTEGKAVGFGKRKDYREKLRG